MLNFLRNLTGYVTSGGYRKVCLIDDDNCSKSYSIHRLVAQTFIFNVISEDLTGDHIDRNNHVSNLRWATKSEQAYNRKKARYKYMKVLQYDLNDTFIREWESVLIASNITRLYKCVKDAALEKKME